MSRVVRLVAVLALGGCTGSDVGQRPQAQDFRIRLPQECTMALTTMDGGALAVKVPRLWVDFERGSILRAYQFDDGRVVLNPYLIKEAPLTESLRAALTTRGLRADWPIARRFHFLNRDELFLFDEPKREGLVATLEGGALAETGGELASLSCREVEPGALTPHAQLFPPDPPIPAVGCADNTIEQNFGSAMIGCAGQVAFPDRAKLCASGWVPCTAAQWVDRFANRPPAFTYWTDDNLRYTGTATNCSVSTTEGDPCSPSTAPMRVCTAELDPLGNRCNWLGCGLETTANHFFGGCTDNLTAGTLCCQ